MTYLFRRLISLREDPGIKLIVFDFDGTLADTKELLLRIIRKHLLSFEIHLTKQLVKKHGDTPLIGYLSLVGVPQALVRSLADTIQEDFIKEYHHIRPCKNLEAVKAIHTRKVIVSNNTTSFVEKSLNYLKANFFDGVYGSDQFENKVQMIKALAKKYKLSEDEIIYVGDKAMDVKVARGVGCISVIIAGKAAWSSREDIAKEKPDYMLTDLGKLPSVISNISSEQLAAV